MIELQRVTGGDQEAIYFLNAWGKYLRRCDNAVDDPDYSPETMIACFALGNTVYSSNFYRKHSARLQMAILVGASLWSIANDWEKSPELWKRVRADVLRDTDVLLLNAVAQICVGWAGAAESSRALLSAANATHVHKHGPVQ